MTLIKNLFEIIKKMFRRVPLAFVLMLLTIAAHAQTPQFLSFLQNKGNVLLPWSATGNSTNYSTSFAANYTGTNGWFYTQKYTQTNSTTYPPTSGWYPNWTQGNPFTDVSLWANRDGTAPLAVLNLVIVNPAVTNGLSTNTFKITLTTLNKMPGLTSGTGDPSQASVYNNQANNQWSFLATNTAASTNATGYDTIAISTNIPQSFLQGAFGVQFQISVAAAGLNSGIAWSNVTGAYNALVTNTVTGPMLQSAGISGFTPVAGN